MNKLFSTMCIVALMSSPVWAQGFDSIEIVNPLNPQPFYSNTIAIPVKKAILTHNITHNQYVYALERFMQSNIKSSYNDFKLLIETIEDSDYAYMQLAENLGEIASQLAQDGFKTVDITVDFLFLKTFLNPSLIKYDNPLYFTIITTFFIISYDYTFFNLYNPFFHAIYYVFCMCCHYNCCSPCIYII